MAENVTVKTLVIRFVRGYSIRETIMGGCTVSIYPPPLPPKVAILSQRSLIFRVLALGGESFSGFIHTLPLFLSFFYFSFRFLFPLSGFKNRFFNRGHECALSSSLSFLFATSFVDHEAQILLLQDGSFKRGLT